MQYRLSESISETGTIIFDFIGFDDWKSFIKIMNIIKNNINPNESNYQGVTDMNGYFEKDGIHVDIQYDEMIGNYLEYKGDKADYHLVKVREWAKIIFDNLSIEVERGK